jgi:XTP/dITP diphosphohydrolase
MKIVLASGNAGKLRELAAILGPLGHELVPQSAFGIETPAETGTTFLDNALLKARHAAAVSGLPALADDSGIEVEALDGRPGVYSARYAGERATDRENNAKLLEAMKDVRPGKRTARYRCVIVLVRGPNDADPLIAAGAWKGRIITAPRGSGGFGYDPLFQPVGLALTAAELPAAEKNERSHRGEALRSLIAQLRRFALT